MIKSCLFIINGDSSVIGGHKISSLSLATAFHQHGWKVGVVMAPLQMDLPDVDLNSMIFYPASLPHCALTAFIKRNFDILKAVCSNRYDVIVAAEYDSVICSIAALLFTGIPLIQIQAGEKVPHFPPLNIPGIFVFSDMVYNGYQQRYGIPSDFLCLSSGRVNFKYFSNELCIYPQKNIFTGEGRKILVVSRLEQKKIPTLANLFVQIEMIGKREIIQLVIIGEGGAQASLQQNAAETLLHLHPKSSITFIGAFRVTPEILKQAELVVGQGRTVLEAIASGVPASVSSEDGYFGLITSSNLLDLRTTDFTGKSMVNGTTLENDLNKLHNFHKNGFEEVYDLAKEFFDVSVGIEAINILLEKYQQLYLGVFSRRWAYLRAYIQHFSFRFIYYLKKFIRRIFRYAK